MSKIKGDLISRAASIRRIKKWINKDDKGDIASFYNRILENVIDALSEMPTVDAVPVIRCKYCEFSDWYTDHYGERRCYCKKHGYGGHTEKDFCSYAGRKTDAE